MKKSDFVIIRINNNGCGIITNEFGSKEVSKFFAECTFAWCKREYVMKAEVRHPNGDYEFWFN